MSAKRNDAERLQRYEHVVAVVLERAEFNLADVKRVCEAMKPLTVTQVVRDLEKDGYVCRDGAKAHATFRWTGDRSQFSPRVWIESKVLNDRMTRSPLSDRPRERLLAQGATRLRTAELLAILIRSGRTGESALQAGEKIAARYSDGIERLESAGRGELKAISRAVADTAYCQIMAGIELGRRIERAAQQRKAKTNPRIRGTSDAVAYCQQEFRRLADEATQEEFHLVCLDTKQKVLGTHLVSIGLLNESLVAPREVFRPAIREAAAAVVLVHNHPSGDPTPSPEDLALTRRLEQAAQTIGIRFIDHLIVARQGCVSIREHQRP